MTNTINLLENNPIPLKWKQRNEQVLVLEKFKQLVSLKKKFLVVSSPVGTGKSYMAVICAHFLKGINPDYKFDILTNTKQLQDQYNHDFEFIKEIKGKDNYVCHQGGHQMTCSEGSELSKATGKQGCSMCTYKTAFNNYKNSNIGILNYALYFSYFVYAEDVIKQRNANVLFIDEAHLFEEGYSKFVNSFLSIGYLVSLDIQITPALTYSFDNIQTKEDFAKFLQVFVIPVLKDNMSQILESMNLTHLSLNNKVASLGRFRRISRTKCKFNRFIMDQQNWKDNWVLEKGLDDKGHTTYKVEVIWATKYLTEIWDKYEHVVLLSGTILDKQLFGSMLNIPKEEVMFTTIQSPFKAENRPIYFLPKGKMSYDCLIETYNNLLPIVIDILKKHKGQKGIIHTGNYKLSEWLKRDIKDENLVKRLIFHNSHDRESQLQVHLLDKEDTIIVSPSMTNGVDLKDDLSRFQIILKVPYPALDTYQVKKRMEQNNKWYSWKTMCDLIQSYGRSVRSEQDWAVTYILDSNFRFLMSKISLPQYVQDALIEIESLDEVKEIQ